MKRSTWAVVLTAIILLVGIEIGIADSPYSEHIIGVGNETLYEDYRGLEEFGVVDAWKMGYTGKEVKVAIIDTGIDFATPDLIGTQARVENEDSPYYGWPIVIDLGSLSQYQNNNPYLNYLYANTSATDTEGYNVTGSSKSGVYHIGDHPDGHLAQYYGEHVKVLVVDEHEAGKYDTVYVDLNNNHDFTDDKPCRKGDEISYWDRDGDGYPDESGGMIYFIADGKTSLPFSRMLYGEEGRIPETGELVAFHFDFSSHGTMCASTIAAQGKNVKGIAPGARLIPVSAFGENDMLLCLIASLGYDGIANTGDEANIISRSGTMSYFNKGTDETSVFLEYLTTEVSPYTTIVYGNGNYGSGYGTCGSPSSEHVINAGAIYDLWWNNSTYRGDVTCFSSRGPNALGQVKPNVLATGFYAPEAKPLWLTHSGKAAWDAWGRGTSDATPHVSAAVALIYQAYKDTHGEFPTSEMARDILMSSADDINEEIFAQGSGIINARRAVEIASGRDGVLIEPALLTTWPVEAGSTLDFEFTISNYSDIPIALKPQRLIKEATKTFTLDLTNESILFPVDNELLNCDLMKVSFYYPRNTKDTKLDEHEGYNLYLYNWKDINHDGRLGPDGLITMDEAQEGELEPIAIGKWGSGFTSETRIHDPHERIDDGVLIGLERRGETESKEVNVVIETYNWQRWDIEIDVDGNQVHASIPTPQESGIYQGKILLEVEDVEKKQCIPISFATYRKDNIKIDSNTTEIYENARMYGRFEGDGTHGFWDSRFYPVCHNGSEIVTIDVTWEDPNTDIDVYLYGEGVVDTSKLWEYPTKSPIELPMLPVLKENGHSMRVWRTIMGEGFMGTGYGLSYSKFYTSTGKNSEVIAGELTDGLNILVLNQVISGGNLYGENVGIRTNITSLEPIELAAEAGETIGYRSPPCVDSIIGFSSGREREAVASQPETFEAKQGDVLLLRSNGTYYTPHLFFDSNGNGTRDRDMDEIVFAECRVGYITHLYTDIIPIPQNGTYFMDKLHGELYHMTEKYVASPSFLITIQAPKEAGTYLGLCTVNGKMVPVPVILEVEPLEPAQIELKAPEIIDCNLPFELEIMVCDRYGNPVEINTSVTIILENTTEEIEIVNGTESVTLNAPETEGEHAIRVKGNFDAEEIYIKATQKPLIDLDSTLNDVVLRNKGGAGIELNLYINPSGFDSVNPVSLKEYTPTYHRKIHLGPGEEEHFDLTEYYAEYGSKQKQSVHPGDPIWKIHSSRMTTVTDNHSNILLYEDRVLVYDFGGPGEVTEKPEKIEELKKIEQIKSVYSDEPITFEAYGVISIQHNESQPLFFVTNGDFSVIPGTPGKLTVRMENETHIVEVLPAASISEPSEEQEIELEPKPAKVEGVNANSSNSKIYLSWKHLEDIDHYNVYWISGSTLIKMDEVKIPEYVMDAFLWSTWSTFSFRISAVNSEGREGELSDPIGIVALP